MSLVLLYSIGSHKKRARVRASSLIYERLVITEQLGDSLSCRLVKKSDARVKKRVPWRYSSSLGALKRFLLGYAMHFAAQRIPKFGAGSSAMFC
jgi:hypothetical protein